MDPPSEFAGLVQDAERLGAVADRLGWVPWTGEAADAFRGYAADLARSVRDVAEAAERCRSAVAGAAADLEALRGPAGGAATLLDEYSAAVRRARAGPAVRRDRRAPWSTRPSG